MKRIFYTMFSLLLSLTILYAETLDIGALKQAQHWRDQEIAFGSLTLEQAKQSIINWAGRTNLIINLLPYDNGGWSMWDRELLPPVEGIEGVTVPYGYYPVFHRTKYVFTVDDPNPDKKYSGIIAVDSWTGRVMGIYKGVPPESVELYNKMGSENITYMITPQQAISLASQYLTDYFPQIAPILSNQSPFLNPLPTSDDKSWTFFSPGITITWDKIANDIGDIQVWVDLVLDSYTGKLMKIGIVKYDTAEISFQPTISEEEALQSALSFLYGLGAEHLEVEEVTRSLIFRPSPGSPQRIVYWIYFENTKARDDAPEGVKKLLGVYVPHKVWVTVDINTGEILGVMDRKVLCGGWEWEKFKSPRIYFNGREEKAKMITKGKDAFVSIDSLKKIGFALALKKGKYRLSFKGKSIDLKQEEVIKENGALLLNVRALNKLDNIKVVYSEKLKTIDIWTVNEKAVNGAKELLRNKKFGLLNLLLCGLLNINALSYMGWKLKRYLA
jgi:hypothetical protein